MVRSKGSPTQLKSEVGVMVYVTEPAALPVLAIAPSMCGGGLVAAPLTGTVAMLSGPFTGGAIAQL